MKYYAQYSGNRLVAVGTNIGGTEITEAEYNRLLSEIREKASLVNQLYSGEITIADVSEAWREEIQRRVGERISAERAEEEAEATEEDYVAALAELGVTVNEEV